MRTLSRETAKVLDYLPAETSGVIVTRDGRPVARISPLSVFEQAMYQELIAQGVDPFNPPRIDPTWQPAPPVAPGEKSASDYLMEDRASYYDEP
jgi:antitoxin (DNA-binding transcriptional repressor) of toxin-antitoxin stability system